MNVPLLDLKAQHATIKDEIAPAIQSVIDTQYFINGPEVKELEKLIAEYCGVKSAVGVSSGTDALIAALMSLGIGMDLPACRTASQCPGAAEVITTPFTFFATAGSIWRAGAKPVFVDIDQATYNIDPAKIEAAITKNTKAIMPVHLFGQCADMDAILKIANKHNLPVIEDGAQAIGATYKGKKAGALGTVGCFSFFPSKNLGGYGDGGMVTTQDETLAHKLLMCRGHGETKRYHHEFVGANFRLDTIQAAALIVKLRHLDDWSTARRANAARYNEMFAGVDEVVTPTILEGCESIYNQYVIRVPKRDALQAHLAANNIGNAVYYPVCLHEQECFTELGYKKGDFPVSEQAASEVVAIPIYPELTIDMQLYVADTIKAFLAG